MTPEPTDTPTQVPDATPTPQISPTPVACVHDGDVNQDGTVTPEDARLAFYLYLACEQQTPSRETYCAADFCGIGEIGICDASVTPADARGIYLNYLGITEPCSNEPEATPTATDRRLRLR